MFNLLNGGEDLTIRCQGGCSKRRAWGASVFESLSGIQYVSESRVCSMTFLLKGGSWVTYPSLAVDSFFGQAMKIFRGYDLSSNY